MEIIYLINVILGILFLFGASILFWQIVFLMAATTRWLDIDADRKKRLLKENIS
jgi:hypothetical protein